MHFLDSYRDIFEGKKLTLSLVNVNKWNTSIRSVYMKPSSVNATIYHSLREMNLLIRFNESINTLMIYISLPLINRVCVCLCV